jgi:hypothetical protein
VPTGMARLNFTIPDDLHEQVRELAADRGQTLKGLVIYELRRAVERARVMGRPFGNDEEG